MKKCLRVYVLDDESASVELAVFHLQSFQSDILIAGTSNSPIMALEEIRNVKPDVLLLDIQMPHLNGFDVIEKLGKDAPAVIFMTAFDQYAIRAIKYSALDYLLKPLDPDELKAALDKIADSYREDWQQEKLMQLLLQLTEKDGIPGKIGIPVQEGIRFIKVSDILYLKADDNYTEIYTQYQAPVIASKTLKYFEELLKDRNFIRIHQSWLIQLSQLEEYLKADGGSVRMSDGKILPVARQRKEGLLDLLSGRN